MGVLPKMFKKWKGKREMVSNLICTLKAFVIFTFLHSFVFNVVSQCIKLILHKFEKFLMAGRKCKFIRALKLS